MNSLKMFSRTKKWFSIVKKNQPYTDIDFKDPLLKKTIKELPEKYYDHNKHPRGTSFNNLKRAIMAKSKLMKFGRPAPLFSVIPGQRPIDLLMTHILESPPQSRKEMWESVSKKQFLNSKSDLSRLLRRLRDLKFVLPFFFAPKEPFRYRFNVAKAKEWAEYVESTKKERAIFLKQFEQKKEQADKDRREIERGGGNTNPASVERDGMNETISQETKNPSAQIDSSTLNDKDGDIPVFSGTAVDEGDEYSDKEKNETEEHYEEFKDSGKGELVVKGEEMEKPIDPFVTDDEWKQLIFSGVGFVKKADKGSSYMQRKMTVMDILGKTGPHPKNRKKALKFIEKKNKDFEVAKMMQNN